MAPACSFPGDGTDAKVTVTNTFDPALSGLPVTGGAQEWPGARSGGQAALPPEGRKERATMQILEAPAIGATDRVTWAEVLRIPAMSVGIYRIPAGLPDPQEPHTEDEVYVVLKGRGTLRAESGDAPAAAGSVLFVPAGEEHRFVDVEEAMEVVVLFAPAEYSLATKA
jgi:mannose-6-phosphate isomerase-like protein (cupin superfamily)